MSSESILGVQVGRRPAATPRARERRGAACVYSWVGSELARLPSGEFFQVFELVASRWVKVGASAARGAEGLLPNDGKVDDQHVLGTANQPPFLVVEAVGVLPFLKVPVVSLWVSQYNPI